VFSFKLLDNYHFEIDAQLSKTEQKAEMQVFMFLPPQLGVDVYTYPKELFYRNLVTEQCYIYGEASLERLSEQISKLHLMYGQDLKQCHKAYWHQLSLLSVQWRRALTAKIKLLQKADNNEEIVETILNLSNLLKQFREKRPCEAQKKMWQSYNYLDEYLNLFICQQLMKLAEKIKENKKLDKIVIQEMLFAFLEIEQQYSIEQGYRQYAVTEQGAERLLTKIQQLQRYLDAPIRLKKTRKTVGVFTEQMVFGFAAAVSMAIATAIAFYTQKMFGNFSTAFFYALVLSYILKDRFKEISRTIIFGYFSRRFFSFSYAIRDRDSKKKVALIKDTCNFISQAELPENIRKLRNSHRVNNSIKDEKGILHYRRMIDVNSSSFPSGQSNLSDCLIFNVSRMIRNLSDNKSTLHFYENNKTHSLIGRQRFSLNLAVSMVKNSEQVVKYYRLLVNRKGVIAVEEIS